MWCTRWYLPLLLLPIPTAPPYFLLLFLFSLTLHAKPCFYCIVLLSTLFVSSCYWQPFPLDSPLTIPWAHNVTTFAEALNSSISLNYSQPLPSVMKAADRCWCDLSSGDFFHPFNVSQWEHISVERVRDELERQHKLSLVSAEQAQATQLDNNTTISHPTSDHSDSDQPTSTHTSRTPYSSDAQQPTETRLKWKAWAMLKEFNWHNLHPISVIPTTTSFLASAPASTTTSTLPPATFNDQIVQGVSSTTITATAAVSGPTGPLPLIRKEYDLRPFGISLTIDFGWTR